MCLFIREGLIFSVIAVLTLIVKLGLKLGLKLKSEDGFLKVGAKG